MTYTLPETERVYLRGLAKRQAEIAALPIMEQRRQMWTDMNDAKPGARPPFVIETGTFDRDFMPDSIYQCKSEYGRGLENGFLRHIRQHEILGDDHICPSTLNIGWQVWSDEFGIEIKTESAKDAEGVQTGYHFECPITDLNDGFDMVKPATFGVDKERTLAEKQFLEETFGDLLPVVIRSGTYGNNNLTQRLMRLMSMETYYMALYDCPEKLQALLALLRDNSFRMSRWAEAEGLLVLNNDIQTIFPSHYGFNTLLPKHEVPSGQVKLTDMWGSMDSQESVGVSPALFHEIVFPLYRELAEMLGFVYWGCCEPADAIWENSLSTLPNLKAISISRWANQDYMAEVLDGTGIVFARKPNPNFLSADVVLNEEGWAAEIRQTLQANAGKNVPHGFFVRDVYTVHGDLGKARRAVEIAHREIDQFFPR